MKDMAKERPDAPGFMFRLDGAWFALIDAIAYLEKQGLKHEDAITYVKNLYREFKYPVPVPQAGKPDLATPSK